MLGLGDIEEGLRGAARDGWALRAPRQWGAMEDSDLGGSGGTV